VVLRDTLVAIVPPMALLLLSLFLPDPLRLLGLLLSLPLALLLSLIMRRRYLGRQGVRVLGNVLEHFDGRRVARVALTRAVVSAAAAPPGVLVLVLDDGRTHLAVGRRAEPHEISDLPPRLGPYLELQPEDFEEVRIAAHRSYPLA
jgi:hypothetical protein